jgi:ribosome-associated protein
MNDNNPESSFAESIMHDDESDREERAPSKTRRKKEAHELQKLGTELLEVPESEWLRLELPDALMAALKEALHIRSRSGRKRQLQYIGKLMRDINPDPIRAWFEQRRTQGRRMARLHQQLEEWRERLIEEGDDAIENYLQQHDADRQQLRQLVRQARKERTLNKPPKASRALFRYLRDLQIKT